MRLVWFLLGVLISAVPMLAFADEYPAPFGWRYSGGSVKFWTADEACASNGMVLNKMVTDTSASCRYDPPTTSTGSASRGWWCPHGGSYRSSDKMCINVEPCPDGQTRNPETGQCEGDQCSSLGGQDTSARFDIGYAYVASSDSELFGVKGPPDSGCSSGNRCKYSISSNPVPGTCSLSVNGPPYPVSCQFNGVYQGTKCGEGEGNQDDVLPPRSCPPGSALGEVNGVAGCYGSYTSSSETKQTTNADGSTTKETTTTNPDGSKTKETTTTKPDGTTETTKETIQSKPPSGTPMPGGSNSGSEGGGNSGSPGGTPGGSGGVGTGGGRGGGSGTGDKGNTEQANFCRDNPTAAMCKDEIKIDEKDTPDAFDWAPVNESLGTQFETMTTKVTNTDWHRTELGFIWNLPSQLPSGSCGPVGIHGFNIDICPALEKARALWAWVIGVLGALAIWIRGTRILGSA